VSSWTSGWKGAVIGHLKNSKKGKQLKRYKKYLIYARNTKLELSLICSLTYQEKKGEIYWTLIPSSILYGQMLYRLMSLGVMQVLNSLTKSRLKKLLISLKLQPKDITISGEISGFTSLSDISSPFLEANENLTIYDNYGSSSKR